MSDKISALTATPDGLFMIAGTETGHISVWQVATGQLWSTTSSHFRRVSVLRLLPDNSVLFSGGKKTSSYPLLTLYS